jgi:sulfur-carrier protein adenylyltransferase/sulfurtransferase
MLNDSQVVRYSRHILLPEVGGRGQEKLLAAKVLLVGAGGLGSPIALYLAAAGIGTLGIMDGDSVDLSNLQRQVIHGMPDIGRNKVESARDTINQLNPDVRVIIHAHYATAFNFMNILSDYDMVIDGCDNFATRYLMNDAAVLLGKPYVYGGIFRFDGQASVFAVPEYPCYRCLFPKAPPAGLVPSCQEAGVFGVIPGVIGLIQATEALKLILGIGSPLAGRLLIYDAREMEFSEVRVERNEKCPVCGDTPSITALKEENYLHADCSADTDKEE